MEVAETVTVLEPILQERSVLEAMRDFLPKPIVNKVTEFLRGQNKYYLVVAVAAVGALKLGQYIQKRNRRIKWDNVGKNVVVFHAIPRGKYNPNLSPFALKLETYLRMADIPYEVDFAEPMGPKGKCPWITLNGESIGDSQLIIEALEEKFEKNTSSHLTPEQIGVARAMRIMTEEHFFWCYETWMCIKDDLASLIKAINLPLSMKLLFMLAGPFMKHKIRNTLHVVGIGRHTFEEIEEMGNTDLEALSAYLGSKPFFTGDKATEIDCAIFGFLAQIFWVIPHSPHGIKMKTDCKNLVDFCNRMKDTFWPDWYENLDPPQSKPSDFHK